MWDRLREDDLAYIDNVSVDIRAVLPYCRPSDLRCSRYMRRPGTLCDAIRRATQHLRTHISRPSSLQTLVTYSTFKVEYVANVFDLTTPRTAFELIFQLYNFLSKAKTDNDG
jgi:hypothetical protein